MSVSRNRSAARHRLEQQVNAEVLSFVDGFRPLIPRPCEAAMARPKTTQHGVKHWWSVLVHWWSVLVRWWSVLVRWSQGLKERFA